MCGHAQSCAVAAAAATAACSTRFIQRTATPLQTLLQPNRKANQNDSRVRIANAHREAQRMTPNSRTCCSLSNVTALGMTPDRGASIVAGQVLGLDQGETTNLDPAASGMILGRRRGETAGGKGSNLGTTSQRTTMSTGFRGGKMTSQKKSPLLFLV